MQDIYILAIDTSCDETSVSVVKNDCVLSNSISSQIELHKKYGGVVPIIGSRAHMERIDPMIHEALKNAHLNIDQIDVYAVTYGPGLAIALQVGIQKAKDLSIQYSKPLIAINHLEGHMYANFARNSKGNLYSNKMEFPILASLISGGHTQFILMIDHGNFKLIGETLDDACGEAFDKVGRMLKLGYPGGPIIEKMAKFGDENKYKLPIPMLQSNDYNMSYSGLKTAVLHLIKDIEGKSALHERLTADANLTKNQIQDIAACFQKVAFKQITFKLEKAIKQYQPKSILLGGGVVENKVIRKEINLLCKKYNLIFSAPTKKMSMDNAAMIGIVAYYHALKKDYVTDFAKLQRNPILNFSK